VCSAPPTIKLLGTLHQILLSNPPFNLSKICPFPMSCVKVAMVSQSIYPFHLTYSFCLSISHTLSNLPTSPLSKWPTTYEANGQLLSDPPSPPSPLPPTSPLPTTTTTTTTSATTVTRREEHPKSSPGYTSPTSPSPRTLPASLPTA